MLTRLVAAAAVISATVLARAVEERADAVVYAGAPISDIRVSANNVNQCSTASITWTGASDPVTLFIAIGGFYVGQMQEVDTQTDVYGGSATWLVDQKAGESMHFRVTDAAGKVAYVQGIVIGDGDDWCLGDQGVTGASASSAGGGSSAATSTWAQTDSTGGNGATTSPASAATMTTGEAPAAQESSEAQASASSTGKSSKRPRSSTSATDAAQTINESEGASVPTTTTATSNSASPTSSTTSSTSTTVASTSSTSTSAERVSAVGANAPTASNAASGRSLGLWTLAGGVALAVGALY